MQYGRAPLLRDGILEDARYDRPGSRNFTTLPLAPSPRAECPPYLTSWTPPRADLLGRN
jgi:hypothetical protein